MSRGKAMKKKVGERGVLSLSCGTRGAGRQAGMRGDESILCGRGSRSGVEVHVGARAVLRVCWALSFRSVLSRATQKVGKRLSGFSHPSCALLLWIDKRAWPSAVEMPFLMFYQCFVVALFLLLLHNLIGGLLIRGSSVRLPRRPKKKRSF